MPKLNEIVHPKDIETARTILTRAKGAILLKEVLFVCNALYKAGEYAGNVYLALALQTEVERRIAPHGTVGDWLREKHGIPRASGDRMREYRVAWLDDMMGELQ